MKRKDCKNYSTKSRATGDMESSIRDLSQYLYTHFDSEVFILIDEYDTPISVAILKSTMTR